MIITSEWELESKEEFIKNGSIARALGKYKRYKLIEDFPKDFKGLSIFIEISFIVDIFRVPIGCKIEIYQDLFHKDTIL